VSKAFEIEKIKRRRTISVSMRQEIIDSLKSTAKMKKISVSQILEQLASFYLENQNNPRKE